MGETGRSEKESSIVLGVSAQASYQTSEIGVWSEIMGGYRETY
jgi:hypothetical protein